VRLCAIGTVLQDRSEQGHGLLHSARVGEQVGLVNSRLNQCRIERDGFLVCSLSFAVVLAPAELERSVRRVGPAQMRPLGRVLVSNVLNGTIERLVLGLNKGAISLLSSTLISSGYLHRGDPAALEVGPTGLAYDAVRDALYVASADDNSIYAMPDATQVSQNGLKGFRIYTDSLHLHGALALTLAPNGNLICSSNDVVNVVACLWPITQSTRTWAARSDLPSELSAARPPSLQSTTTPRRWKSGRCKTGGLEELNGPFPLQVQPPGFLVNPGGSFFRVSSGRRVSFCDPHPDLGQNNVKDESRIGAIAVGKKADLVLVDLAHPLMRPARDPLRSLIYYAADRAVRDVARQAGPLKTASAPAPGWCDEVIFALLVFTMRGRWSPRAAKRDFDEHEQIVAAELARMIGTDGSAPPGVEGAPTIAAGGAADREGVDAL